MCLVEKAMKDMRPVWSLRGMSARLVWHVDGLVLGAAAEAIVEKDVGRPVGRLWRRTFS